MESNYEDNNTNNFKRPFKDDDDSNAKRPKFNGNIHVNLRVLIPSKHAGPVIGKGGSNIKSLRDEYNATVLLPDSDGPERILNIATNLGNTCDILYECLNYIEPASSNPERSIRVLIHQSQAGAIIGKQGFKIKELREQTGASIKIYTECAPMSSDRIVQLGGSVETIVNTVNVIMQFLDSCPIKGFENQYDPDNYDESFANEYGGFTSMDSGDRGRPRGGRGGGMRGMRGMSGFIPPMHREMMGPRGRPPYPMQRGRGGRGGMMGGMMGGPGGFRGSRGGHMRPMRRPLGRHGPGGEFGGGNYDSFEGMDFEAKGMNQAEFDPNEDVETTQVSIPKEMAGAIIGKGGSRIKQIRMESCATITIDEPLEGSEDRIINITGTPSQIENAQYLLQMSVKKNMGKY